MKKRIRVVPSPRVRGVRLALNEYKAGQSRVCAGFFLSRMERERERERWGELGRQGEGDGERERGYGL